MMPGMIMLWAGAIVDIPSGWTLCDGTVGTPNLKDRFVVGAGGGFAPDDSGGATFHKHSFTGDGHIHSIGAGIQIEDGYPDGEIHNVTDSQVASGDTDNNLHMPPYYALCYIMKL